MSDEESKFAVVIASKGRPAILTETAVSLENQSVPVKNVFLAVTGESDVEESCAQRPEVTVLISPPGLTGQRNAAIQHVADRFECLIFLDDDMQLHADYIAEALKFLDSQPGVVGFSGYLLRSGKVSRTEAKELVDAYRPDPKDFRPLFRCRGPHWILHGCNMVIRSHVLKYERFDENLPLYAFAEDYDMSLRIRNYGLVGRFRDCVAVHLETPSGRVSERKLGYATVANNWYFLRKSLTHCPSLTIGYARFVLRLAALEPFRNALAAVTGNRDRGGRLKGNILALRDILTGKSSPDKINQMD
jgi:GT2 family glycosyltransferase